MLKFTKTNRTAELEGVTTEYDDGYGNTLGLKIARSSNNPHYEAKLTKLMEPHKKKMRKGQDISPEAARKIMTQVLAEEILLGWNPEDLLDDEGKPTPYSTENALELLHNDPDLRDFISDYADNMGNYLDSKKVAGK